MTKEDLQQFRELLQEQKQDLIGLMDTRLQEQKQGLIGLMDTKLQEQKQGLIQCMNIIIESEITPKFNLLADEIAGIKSTMATKEQLNDLEVRMNDRFDVLEAAVKYHGNEINRLKKAL